MCYDAGRMRRVSYRSAATAFVFTGLWFVFGIVFLLTPIAGSLGIRGQMFVAWLLLFFLALILSGGMLLAASLHQLFGEGGGRRPRGRTRESSPAEYSRATRPGPARAQRR